MTQVDRDDELVVETPQPPTSADRRAHGERRRYNRRSSDSQVSPPYYEAFDRIATALEHIERVVMARLAPPTTAQEDPPSNNSDTRSDTV